jgi:hypothetical protein
VDGEAVMGDKIKVFSGLVKANPNGEFLRDDLTWAVAAKEKAISLYCVEGETSCAVASGVGYFLVPPVLNGLNIAIDGVMASVVSAGVTGTMDIRLARRRSGFWVNILSRVLTIDSTKLDSSTATAAEVNTANDDVHAYDLIRADIDKVHTTPAQGLVINVGFE